MVIFWGCETLNEAVSVVPAFVGDEFHSDPSVGVCSISWLCVYSKIWSRSIAQEIRQGVLIISNSLCSLGAQKGSLLLFCHKFNTTATNSNTTIYILRCRLGVQVPSRHLLQAVSDTKTRCCDTILAESTIFLHDLHGGFGCLACGMMWILVFHFSQVMAGLRLAAPPLLLVWP